MTTKSAVQHIVKLHPGKGDVILVDADAIDFSSLVAALQKLIKERPDAMGAFIILPVKNRSDKKLSDTLAHLPAPTAKIVLERINALENPAAPVPTGQSVQPDPVHNAQPENPHLRVPVQNKRVLDFKVREQSGSGS